MFAQNPGTGFTIWITGMQGAGKSALAREVFSRLKRIEKPVEMLEGLDWDVFIGKGPGSTKEERNAIMRRAGFVARAITRAGGFVIVPQVSPIRETREALRREIGRFLEVFIDCPFDTLLARDTTGQYQKAMRGDIPNFIGVTDPYEPPGAPEVKFDSSKVSVDDGATMIMEALVREGALTPRDIGLSRMPRAPAEDKDKKSKKPPEPILFTPGSLTLPKPSPAAKAEQARAAAAAAKAALTSKAIPVPARGAAAGKAAKAAPVAKIKPEKAAKVKPEKIKPVKAAKVKPEKIKPVKAAKVKPEKVKPVKAAKVKPAKAAKVKPEKAAARRATKKPARAAKPAKAAARRREAPARAAKKTVARARKSAPPVKAARKKIAAKTARAKPVKAKRSAKVVKKAKKSKR
jgi:adenylylsulfate kinase-like enzyme